MEADIVIQGQQQLHYSNEFDELTYNADNIVQITSQLDKVLKRFSHSFSSKDSAFIINKNLTAFVYWFVVDALYFVQNTPYEVNRINYIRKTKNLRKSSVSNWGQPFQDEKFVIKMRSLVLRNNNYQDLSQIKQTSVQQLIELFEKQHQNISQNNDGIMHRLSNQAIEDRQRFNQALKQLNVVPVEASLLFSYYNFQKQMIREWMDQVEINKFRTKCQICSRTDDLVKCQKCDLQVHLHCYPKLPRNYDKKQFLCQNCQKELDQKTCCVYCPVKGGHFLQVEHHCQRRTIFTIQKCEGSMKMRVKRQQAQKERHFMHLSCSLWHPELEYNMEKGMLQNIHRVDRKKIQMPCYQCGTNAGVTIPCANQNCRRFYHLQCGKKIDLSTIIINAKNKLLIELYCERHRRPYIYEILKQNILNNLKQVKKLYEGVDHQIKRMLSTSFHGDRRTAVKNQQPERYNWCLYCRNFHQDQQILTVPIVNCCKCYNWYHKNCGRCCPICEQVTVVNSTKP